MTCSRDDLYELAELLLKHADGDQAATARALVDELVPLIARREAMAAAAVLWNPDVDPQLRASADNDWWRGHHTARLTCSQMVLERVGLLIGPDGQITGLEIRP